MPACTVNLGCRPASSAIESRNLFTSLKGRRIPDLAGYLAARPVQVADGLRLRAERDLPFARRGDSTGMRQTEQQIAEGSEACGRMGKS